MTLTGLQIVWYVLFFVLITGYAILDGFDLGVGIVHLFTRDKEKKKQYLRAIAPFWDGNEVWLLTGGGALFAAFPPVYATLFSSFYLAFMLLLLGLIFRAISIEFRLKMTAPFWAGFWDIAFGVSSLIPALLVGVALANVIQGIPIDESGTYTGSFLGLLNPYALLGGVVSLVAFALHGGLYLNMKYGKEPGHQFSRWIAVSWMLFVSLYVIMMIASFFASKYLFSNLFRQPLYWLFFILFLASTLYISTATKKGNPLLAFLSSCTMLLSILAMCGVALFPKLLPSSINLDYSLTIFNSSSTLPTLKVMFLIAMSGVPVVLIYTFFIYRIFKGKVDWAHDGY